MGQIEAEPLDELIFSRFALWPLAEPCALSPAQVPGGPVEWLQHQAAFGRRPPLQPSLREPAVRGVQLPAAGQLGPRGDAASAALQTRRPLRDRHPGAQRCLQGNSVDVSGKELAGSEPQLSAKKSYKFEQYFLSVAEKEVG